MLIRIKNIKEPNPVGFSIEFVQLLSTIGFATVTLLLQTSLHDLNPIHIPYIFKVLICYL